MKPYKYKVSALTALYTTIRTEPYVIKPNLNVDNCIYNLSVNDVKNVIDRLKLDKSEGEEGLNSNHIINGPHLLIVLPTDVFNCMLIHGVCPDSMISGPMVPIPKAS